MALPIFETERLILRGVTREDIPAYQKYFADYEVIRHLSAGVPWPYPKDGVETFLEEKVFPTQGKNSWLWGIFLKKYPTELIGSVQIWRDGKPENRGFWLARQHHGNGYMTEAVEPVMDYAFNELGFKKIILSNALGNVKSRRVKEKNGAKFLYVEPAKFVDPQYTEHEVWELMAEDWFARQKS